MGLDMYLSKRHYVKNWDHMRAEQRHNVTVKLGSKPHPTIKPDRVSFVTEQVAYWRKRNYSPLW